MQTTAELIRQLRREKGLTQAQLAQRIHVSPKAVSKWERSAGLPDASIVPLLSAELGVGAEALLSGFIQTNPCDGGNMKRIRFHQCPACGNILTATGKAEIVCCSRRLEPMQLRSANNAHRLTITPVEDEWLVSWAHPMEKAHHLTFLAQISDESVHIVRLYPEGAQEKRLPRMPWATLCCGCSTEPGVMYTSKAEVHK